MGVQAQICLSIPLFIRFIDLQRAQQPCLLLEVDLFLLFVFETQIQWFNLVLQYLW